MKLYLLESIASDLEFDEGKIIALTPDACYSLDKKGLDYDIVEDYFDDDELFADRLSFQKEQSEYFRLFDSFLKSEIPQLSELKLDIATLYSFPLKTSIFDPLIYKSRVIVALFEQLKPTEVIFIKSPGNDIKNKESLSFNDTSLFSKLIPMLCQEKSVKFQIMTGIDEYDTNIFDIQRKQNIFSSFKSIPKIISFIFASMHRKKDSNTLNIFQTNLAYNGFQTIIDLLKNGHNAYVLNNNKIYLYKHFRLQVINLSKLRSPKAVPPIGEWERVFQKLIKSELLSWVSDRCQIDVTDLILPKLELFLTDICPEILDKFIFFADFYQKNSIDAILSPFMQTPIELAAIGAAKSAENPKIFCVEHGDDIFKNIFFRLEELSLSDVIITTNDEHKKYLGSLCKQHGLKTNVHVCKHRLMPLINLHAKNTHRKIIKQTKSSLDPILFVPTFFTGESLRIDCDIHLSPTAYYKFQKRILSHLASRKEHTFIWKGLPAVESFNNPVPQMIADEKISNVIFESKPFVDYLKNAHRVILDYPSTGMYESIYAGISTMSLCDTNWKYRLSAVEKFSHNISFFSNADEAVVRIDEFLDTSPETYVSDFEQSDLKLITIIESEFEDTC